jgi:flagellar hook-associated protein 3 FlgL
MSDIIRIQANQSEVDQYLKNIATGESRLNFADTTLQGVQTMIERIRVLGLMAMSNTGTASLQTTEVAGLRDQILASANASFDGQFIFAGSNLDSEAYSKAADGTVSYNGNAEQVQLQIDRATTMQIQLPGSEVFTGPVDIFATIQSLVNAMNSGDKTAMQTQITNLEEFSTNLSGALGKVGGLVNLARSVQRDLTQYQLARTAERSRIEDADLAVALTNMSQAQTALQAATAAGARISNLSILDYLT